MPPKSQTTAQAETAFDPEILIRLSGSVKQFNERFTPVIGAASATTTATRENVLVVSTGQMKALVPLFTEAAQNAERSGYPSFSAPFLRVASSLEKMSSGMKGMVDAPRVAGQLTKTGNVHMGAGAVAFTAGFITLFGGNGPDYSGPLSEIHSEIQALRQETQRHFRQLAEGLLTQINGLKSTLSHVMDNQRIILNAVNQVHEGVDHIQQLLSEHARTTEAMHSHLIMRDLIKARGIIERYLENSSQIRDEAVFRSALDELQGWLLNGLNDPMINGVAHIRDITSESMVEKLNQQSPFNQMGLIAARLRFLFGDDILDAKYTRLPPLEIYQSTVALYLLGTQKSGCYGGDGCQRICEDIQNTLQLFADALKKNEGLMQALFDRYDYHRDRLGRIMSYISKPTYGELAKHVANSGRQNEFNETLHAMEEIRLLSCALSSFVDPEATTSFASRVQKLVRKEHIYETMEQDLVKGFYPSNCMKRFLGEISESEAQSQHARFLEAQRNYRQAQVGDSEKAQYRLGIQAGYNAFTGVGSWSILVTSKLQSSDFNRPGWFQETVDKLYLVLMQEDSGVSFKSIHSDGNCSLDHYTWVPYQFNPAFLSYLTSGLTTKYSNYDSNWWDSNCDKKLYTLRIRELSENPTAYQSAKYIPVVHTHLYTYSIFILYLISDCLGRVNFSSQFPMLEEEKAFLQNALNPASPLSIHHLRTTFNYYKLISQGRLREAQLLFDKNINTQSSVNADSLLWLVAILGEWRIFEGFIKQHPLPANFNYDCAVEDGSLTPLMIAAQHGREDVVNGLLERNNPFGPSCNVHLRSLDNKSAAQLAYEQGFYKIALSLFYGLNSEERIHCRRNIPKEVTPAAITSIPNQLVIDLAQMKEDVGNLQREFQTQARRAARVAALEVKSSVCAEESDADQEDDLESATMKFFEKPDEKLARPTTKCWRTPEPHRTGERVMRVSFFADRLQARRFSAHIKTHDFSCVMDSIDGEPFFKTVVKRDIA